MDNQPQPPPQAPPNPLATPPDPQNQAQLQPPLVPGMPANGVPPGSPASPSPQPGDRVQQLEQQVANLQRHNAIQSALLQFPSVRPELLQQYPGGPEQILQFAQQLHQTYGQQPPTPPASAAPPAYQPPAGYVPPVPAPQPQAIWPAAIAPPEQRRMGFQPSVPVPPQPPVASPPAAPAPLSFGGYPDGRGPQLQPVPTPGLTPAVSPETADEFRRAELTTKVVNRTATPEETNELYEKGKVAAFRKHARKLTWTGR
jgi:hypothetical protein